MKRVIKSTLALGTGLATIAGIVLVPAAVNAATENTTINAELSSGISITTSGTVTLNITPTGAGSYTSAADTVTVGTNSTAGYTLKLNDNDAEAALVHTVQTTNKLTAVSGTIAVPAALAVNQFGFRLNDSGATTGFGTGYGAAETNQASLGSDKWAAIPLASDSTTNTIRVTSAANASDAVSVYYGASADFSKPQGTYSDSVLYTATAN